MVIATLVGVGVACMAFAARAAEDPKPIARFVLWDESNDRAWTTPKGNTASATNATACLLSMSEASREAPSGTRFSCRKTIK